MSNKIEIQIGFHYLLTEMQLCTLIILEFYVFWKKVLIKPKVNQSLAAYLEYNLMIQLCVDFVILLT